MNHTDVLLHSDANTSLIFSPHLYKLKYIFNIFYTCLPALMLNKKSLLNCFEKVLSLALMTFLNLLR